MRSAVHTRALSALCGAGMWLVLLGCEAEKQELIVEFETTVKVAQTTPVAPWREAHERSCELPDECFLEGRRAMLDEEYEIAERFLKFACEQEKIEACQRYAKILEKGKGDIKQDEERAEVFLDRAVALTLKACEAGNALRCAEMGERHAWGRGVEQDRKLMMSFYDRACKEGDTRGCRLLGASYLQDRLKQYDPVKAAKAFVQACHLEETPRCSDLARMLSDRDFGMREVALPLVQEACDGEDVYLCAPIAEMYEQGIGVERDEERAKALFERACTPARSRSCARLGSMYQTGALVPQDALRALAALRKACSGGSTDSCGEVEEYLKKVNPQPASEQLKVECKEKADEACYTFAHSLLPGEGRLPNEHMAASYFKSSCELGYIPSCLQLADMFELGVGVPRSYPDALAAYQRACTGGSGEACHKLARMHALGIHVPRSEETAVSFSERACDLGEARSCTEAGIAHLFGNGVARDYERAVSLLERACDHGHARGCAQFQIAESYAATLTGR